MKHSRLILLTLISGLVLGVFCLASDRGASDTQKQKSSEENIAATDEIANPGDTALATDNKIDFDKIIIYYFHGTRRCLSCRKLEANTKEAIDSLFADHIKNGVIEFQVVNMDQSNNRHFMNDYKLFTKSVVLSKIKDGYEVKWKNLDKIWQLYRNKPAYYEYIQAEIHSFMENN